MSQPTNVSAIPPQQDPAFRDWERATSQLARAGRISQAAAEHLIRQLAAARERVEATRVEVADALYAILRGVEDGALVEGVHFHREHSELAVAVEAAVAPLSSAHVRYERPSDMRTILSRGARLWPEIFLRSARCSFAHGARHRAMVIDVHHARRFVGMPPERTAGSTPEPCPQDVN